MKQTSFFHHDHAASTRYSDGLYFLIAPEINGQEICFYCDEHDLFARSLEDFHHHQFIKNKKSIQHRPAIISEICSQGFAELVDGICCFDTNAKQSNYIHFEKNSTQQHHLKQTFFYQKHASLGYLLCCHVQNFHDKKIYFYSPEKDCFWFEPVDTYLLQQGMARKNLEIVPSALTSIHQQGYLAFLSGVAEYRIPSTTPCIMNQIDF